MKKGAKRSPAIDGSPSSTRRHAISRLEFWTYTVGSDWYCIECHGVPGSSRALGWDTPSEGSSAGTLFSPRSFGHTGFTGTSLWIDPERHLFLILLTNRVHPSRENNAHLRVRPAVADALVHGLVRP